MDPDTHGQSNGMRWRAPLAFVGFGAIAAFFLLTEHRAHLLGILPWVLLLACPLLHVFMHGGHGGYGKTGGFGQNANHAGSDRSNATPPDIGAHRH